MSIGFIYKFIPRENGHGLLFILMNFLFGILGSYLQNKLSQNSWNPSRLLDCLVTLSVS